jgi:3'(2'), 5'-bisphosphate nucleotidase
MTGKDLNIEILLLKAIQASLIAGEEILKIYDSDYAIEKKADASPLTIADKNAHNSICESLKNFGFPILSEEGNIPEYSERKDWEYFWMVDPLDGTKEFIKHNGEFTVNIALIHQQRSILGVIFIPVTNTLYFAAKDLGSYKLQIDDVIEDNLQGIISQSLKLPLERKHKKFTVVASRSHMSMETEMFIEGFKTIHKDIEFITSGSSSKLCLVAEGSADVYPRFAPTMEWDTAAGQVICELANKMVIDYNTNEPLLYNKKDLLNSWFIVK